MSTKFWFVVFVVAVAFAVFGENIGDQIEPSIGVLKADQKHIWGTLILSVVSWMFYFGSIVGKILLVLLGAGFPLLYGLFRLIENRWIPGPIDDWIAAAYEPLRPKLHKGSVLWFLKWSGIVCLIVGGCLLGSNTYLSPYGFVLLASSSGQWLVASLIERNKEQIALYATMFILVDCFGVYRWLVAH